MVIIILRELEARNSLNTKLLQKKSGIQSDYKKRVGQDGLGDYLEARGLGCFNAFSLRSGTELAKAAQCPALVLPADMKVSRSIGEALFHLLTWSWYVLGGGGGCLKTIEKRVA
jgi:hypothetical protein